jgi:hypothetical protein
MDKVMMPYHVNIKAQTRQIREYRRNPAKIPMPRIPKLK